MDLLPFATFDGFHSSPSSSRPSLYLPSRWTLEDNKLFELALVRFPDGMPNRWQIIASLLPGKSPQDVLDHHRRLLIDVAAIEAGMVELPNYIDEDIDEVDDDDTNGKIRNNDGIDTEDGQNKHQQKSKIRKNEESKIGKRWTEDEHRRFLRGLEKHGKGDSRAIARCEVKTKTSRQVESHAQRYFKRKNSASKKFRRKSIHDITEP
ncbi:Myb domain plants domain-containing protein [Dioscorea alata]|uniref:Myb domain plants domain-containing protein n=1 Tax=Dioscorea alata TaxID=55571 RepID=A0ACB7TTD5_DIOAL|nr:Myb domain plants domain-containing protein [Dioscorea alata]